MGKCIQDEKGKNMSNVEAIMIVEGDHDVDEQMWLKAWQHLINTGLCWQLQGWYGRQAMRLIEDGRCYESKANVHS